MNNNERWLKNYELAKKYYEHHSNLEILQKFKTKDGYTYDELGINLGSWISTQRQNYKNGLLDEKKILLLRKINMRFDNKKNIYSWEEWYNLAKKYYDFNNNLLVPINFKTCDGYTYDEDGINLGIWIRNQKNSYNKGELSTEKIISLEKIGMNFKNKIKKLSWNEWYEYAKKYFEHHGNLEINSNFKTKDGYTFDENGCFLGRWIIQQRQKYKNGKLDENEMLLLNKIGMNYNPKNINYTWKEMYQYVKKYYEHYKNLEVPHNFKTNDGYTYDEDGNILLGIWINSQRCAYYHKNISKEKILLLKKLNMDFERKLLLWEEWYNLAKIYYEHYGNSDVPARFKTNDGYTYDEDGIKLGQWISHQRNNCKNGLLSDNKKKMLDEIKFQLEVNILWEEWYNLAKKYYEFYGNLEVPGEFKTNDGYTYDEDGIKLGQWIFAQRRRVKQDSKRAEMLKEIGMRFDKKRNKYSWEEWYNLAKIYYESYSNLLIPQNFKTNDGYTYDEDGITLGNWIMNLRKEYKNNKITEDKIYLLEQIGMIWNIKKYDNDIKKICLKYNIDYIMNKDILSHISIQEFETKINYLVNNNISLINEDGRIHEIFNMSSVAIKEKYNILLEEMLNMDKNIQNVNIQKNKI